MHVRLSIVLIFSIFLLSAAKPSYGHSHSHAHVHGDSHELQKVLELYRMAVELEPMITAPQGPAVASIEVAGQRMALNSHFWSLVAGWIRLYHQEVQNHCHHCEIPSVEETLLAAKEELSQSMFRRKVLEPLLNGMEHLTLETVQVGAELGRAALVAKIAAEIAETVGSKVIGGGGLHVFCTVFDGVILFGTRHIQTFYRVPVWSQQMGQNSLKAFIKQAYLAHSLRRAQKSVSFEFGPIEIDSEILQKIDSENQRRWWVLKDRGHREAWVKRIVSETREKIAELTELAEAKKHIESPAALNAIRKRIAELRKQLTEITRLSHQDFSGFGTRKLVVLQSEERARYIKGHTPMDRANSKSVLWILSAQENILNRALVPNPHNEAALEKYRRIFESRVESSDHNEVRVGLAKEFLDSKTGSSEHERNISLLLEDIEKIFDHRISSHERYLQVAFIESTTAGFLRFLTHQLLDATQVSGTSRFQDLKNASALRWRVGQLTAYIYEYADFLRIAAAQSDISLLAENRYEAMDAFLRVFSYLQHLKELPSIQTEEDLKRKISELDQLNRDLKNFRPWIMKSSRRGPWGGVKSYVLGPPRCEDLEASLGRSQ